ncbi:PH domain-containing protein [Oenococcus sicerae]|uniref:YdbS-like PH domain-containing protein n=1 Tax=Oenococcus sicerae TaxID=2203724 RepID=A0AAJ1RE19_9LACO|nr:PH domain-containing protein [Oenococcus sicerae]MDN6900206.1 hypothetical protein [Oenococcus sicerae]
MTKASHLHPFSIIGFIYKNLRSTWYLWIYMFFNVKFDNTADSLISLAELAAVLLVFIMMPIVRYYCLTYEFNDNSLTIHSGLFVRQHNHIPYSRIQTIQHKQWFFLKPFNLESLAIETAGHNDGKAEAQLAVIPVKTAHLIEQLNRRSSQVVSTETIEADHVVEPQAVYDITANDLSLYAITSVGLIPALIAVGSIMSQLDRFLPDHYVKAANNYFNHLSLSIALLLFVLIAILSLIVSYLRIVLRYYHFQLTKTDQKLTTIGGFFQRNTVTTPINRIQAVCIKQSILRQWLKLATVNTIIASNAAKSEDDHDDLLVIPVISNKLVFNKIHAFISWLPAINPNLNHLSVNKSYYFIRNAVIISLLPIGLAIYFWRPFGYAALLLLAVAASLGYYKSRQTAFAQVGDQQLVLQVGRLWTKELYFLPWQNIQSINYHRTVWMVHKNLAHLTINIRHGNSNQAIQLRYLSDQTANSIYNWYLRRHA